MRPMTELDELAALVAEALEIREPAEDKQRRLAHLERDIVTTEELTIEESDALIARLDAARTCGDRA